jgi:Kef-type K+ transport system membrane component KefB
MTRNEALGATNTERLRTALAYLAMIGGSIGAFLLIRAYGRDLSAPPPSGTSLFGEPGVVGKVDVLPHVLLAMVTVIIVARALGAAFRYIQQPPVIGEVLAGILLGPSLLGRVAPGVSAYILPPTVAPFLSILSQVGVILFMFLVGLELDTNMLRKRTHSTVAISHASIIAPFLLGSALSLWLYPMLSSSDVPFTSFALFLGVSMSVTAFPVLARILTDRNMHRSRLGVIALTCAAVDDVTAWCLLAFVVSVVQARASGAAITIALTFGYVALMFAVVRPTIARLVKMQEAREKVSQGAAAVVFVALLLSALATEHIGIHALFGAFLLGAIIPHDSKLARDMVTKLEDLVIVLLLPAFFAFTGMRTQIGLLSGVGEWLVCLAIIAVASLGKFGGSAAAARLSGLGWRDSASLGILMNTRGLMELIVLNIGLDLRVISPTLFAMLVVMAIVTTIATTPVLHLLTRKQAAPEAEAAPAG